MPSIMPLRLGLLLICVLALTACDAGESGGKKDGGDKRTTTGKILDADDAVAAQNAAKQMLALAQSGAWDTLIDSYYAENDKIKLPQQKQQLIDRFDGPWGKTLIEILEKASAIRPVIEDEKALFKEDGQTVYTLHPMGKGKWGFKL